MSYLVTTAYQNITDTNYSNLEDFKVMFNTLMEAFLSQLSADEASDPEWINNESSILNTVNNPVSESFDVNTQTYTRVRDWGSEQIYVFFRNKVESKNYSIEPYSLLSNEHAGLIKTVISVGT